MPRLIVACFCVLTGVRAVAGTPVDVPKTNPLPVYLHYMPWFETPDTLGGNQWGWHWTMNTANPNVVGTDGQRQIASHYYPLIGPYASRDPHVIEYHMLLMKLAGVDGVLIDWYGVQGTNGDLNDLLTSSNAIVDRTGDFGLDFGVVLEDRFSANLSQAQANVAYLRDHYFNHPQYIRNDTSGDPLLLSFGPITFESEAEWTQILSQAGEDVDYLPLWYESNDAGSNADGEYSWVYEDEPQDNYLGHLNNFYQFRAPTLDVAGGSAFPGFDDYYEAGGVGDIIPFDIPHDNGQTLAATLGAATQHSGAMDFLQLVTWNDFGEGTMFEPTVETGFDYLVQLQQFTGVPFDQDDLELVLALYLARQESLGDAEAQAALDDVSALLTALELDLARDRLALITGDALAGDFNGSGQVEQGDLDLVLSNWGRDIDADGVPAGWVVDLPVGQVEQSDLDRVLQGWGAQASPDVPGASVPEPGAGAMFLVIGGATARRVRPCRSLSVSGVS